MQSLIEMGLSRRWHRLRLPGSLEDQYRAMTDRQGGAYVRSWLAILVLFNILSLPMDLDVFGAETAGVPIALTLGVFCPLALVAILLLRGRPTVLRQSLAALTVVLADIAIVLNSARLAPMEHRDGYIIIAAIVPLVCGLIAPLPFRHCAWFCAASLALYVGLVIAFGLADAGGSGLPLLVSGLILVPLKLSYSREWQAKQTFLMSRREALQAEALADANARLVVLSQTDALTTLANRRSFSDGLEDAWRAAGQRGDWLAVILVDIDHFKLLNDAGGHAEGDRCLRMIAEALRQAIGPFGGLMARYGGEEFAAIVPRARLEVGLDAGEALRASVATLSLGHPGFSDRTAVSVSVGVTAARGGAVRIGTDELLRTADLALYAAKGKGRNRVEGWMPAAHANGPAPTAGDGTPTLRSVEAAREDRARTAAIGPRKATR